MKCSRANCANVATALRRTRVFPFSHVMRCHGKLLLKSGKAETMGATLSSRVEWTSASDKGGKLDFSKTNENILREIVKYVETLCRNNPREALVVFKHPFVWQSSLGLSNFEPLRAGDEYVWR